jgi:hypothetical protein
MFSLRDIRLVPLSVRIVRLTLCPAETISKSFHYSSQVIGYPGVVCLPLAQVKRLAPGTTCASPVLDCNSGIDCFDGFPDNSL